MIHGTILLAGIGVAVVAGLVNHFRTGSLNTDGNS